jgi:large subunit ribosomal protein L1
MATISKRKKATWAKVEAGKFYPIDEALGLLKETASAKFDESVDVSVISALMHVNQTKQFVAPR